jgi:hypothetical protein
MCPRVAVTSAGGKSRQSNLRMAPLTAWLLERVRSTGSLWQTALVRCRIGAVAADEDLELAHQPGTRRIGRPCSQGGSKAWCHVASHASSLAREVASVPDMMNGMMAGMWVWIVVGVLLIILLVAVIVKLLRKK